jgi:hypothetical protein
MFVKTKRKNTMNAKTIKAFYIVRDSPFNDIKEIQILPEQLDNANYFKTLKEAKKFIIEDLQYFIQEYKNNIKYIKSIK